jgi:hypothetical protein
MVPYLRLRSRYKGITGGQGYVAAAPSQPHAQADEKIARSARQRGRTSARSLRWVPALCSAQLGAQAIAIDR